MKFLLYGSLFLVLLIGGCYKPELNSNYINSNSVDIPVEEYAQGDRTLLERYNPLSLRRACKIALANNPTYRATFHAIRSARMRYYQSWGAYSPSLDLSLELGEQTNISNGSSDNAFYAIPTVQVSWVVFDGLAREFSLLAAKEGQNEQRLLSQNARRLLLRAVGYTFCDLFNAERERDIAIANAEFQRSHYLDAEKKYTIGEISLSDKLNFLSREKQAEQNLIKALQSYKLSKISLAILLGYPDGRLADNQGFVMQDDGDFLVYTEKTLLNEALTNRPDLNALRSKLKREEYELYTSYADYMPTIELFANYSYSSNELIDLNNSTSGVSNFYEGGNSFNYGVSASLNLFKGFQSYNKIRSNKALLGVAYLKASSQWLQVVEEVRNAFVNYNDSIALEAVAAETLEIMRQERDLVDKEYRVGVVDIVRLNQAQTNFVSSSLEYSQALTRKKRAKIELNSAIGAL